MCVCVCVYTCVCRGESDGLVLVKIKRTEGNPLFRKTAHKQLCDIVGIFGILFRFSFLGGGGVCFVFQQQSQRLRV